MFKFRVETAYDDGTTYVYEGQAERDAIARYNAEIRRVRRRSVTLASVKLFKDDIAIKRFISYMNDDIRKEEEK